MTIHVPQAEQGIADVLRGPFLIATSPELVGQEDQHGLDFLVLQVHVLQAEQAVAEVLRGEGLIAVG